MNLNTVYANYLDKPDFQTVVTNQQGATLSIQGNVSTEEWLAQRLERIFLMDSDISVVEFPKQHHAYSRELLLSLLGPSHKKLDADAPDALSDMYL